MSCYNCGIPYYVEVDALCSTAAAANCRLVRFDACRIPSCMRTHQQRAHLQLRPLHVQCDKPRVKTFSLLSADMQHLIEKLIGTCVVSLECRQSLEGSLCIDDDDSKVPT